ncbi:hypothetical protein ABDK00_018195 [Niabella insulamsoli]|uniref:hypothetical protein n=1 Tax=Niabella insulamsoli TaxID=3144874 RepID=UPI0031FBF1E2
MYKDFLRKDLQNSSYGVYRKILEVYREQLAFLETPARFRRWLAVELEIPIEQINLSSLSSALQYRRKKEKALKPDQQQESKSASPNNKECNSSSFTFSNPSSEDKRQSRITEL